MKPLILLSFLMLIYSSLLAQNINNLAGLSDNVEPNCYTYFCGVAMLPMIGDKTDTLSSWTLAFGVDLDFATHNYTIEVGPPRVNTVPSMFGGLEVHPVFNNVFQAGVKHKLKSSKLAIGLDLIYSPDYQYYTTDTILINNYFNLYGYEPYDEIKNTERFEVHGKKFYLNLSFGWHFWKQMYAAFSACRTTLMAPKVTRYLYDGSVISEKYGINTKPSIAEYIPFEYNSVYFTFLFSPLSFSVGKWVYWRPSFYAKTNGFRYRPNSYLASFGVQLLMDIKI